MKLNLVNVPPGALAASIFNELPVPLDIQGVRSSHINFFSRLERIGCAPKRTEYFKGYMDLAFSLHQWDEENSKSGSLSIKNSYIRFLLGWMYDSNSPEGAALKGWVESRFGIAPTFHKAPIIERDSLAFFQYEKDRVKGLGFTNAIYQQLDLLYEFIQNEIRVKSPGATHLTLYRGVNDFEEHRVVAIGGKNRYKVRLNNLNSFTRDYERAWEFGTRVMEARVPLVKILFDGALLHGGLLQGEEEIMVIGGEYEITLRWY